MGTREAADPRGSGDHLNNRIPTRHEAYLFASLNLEMFDIWKGK